jgi:transposase InsO family protein
MVCTLEVAEKFEGWEELLWLRECHSPFELADALGKWVESYNRFYLHSSLGYRSPIKVEEKCQNRQITLLIPAC